MADGMYDQVLAQAGGGVQRPIDFKDPRVLRAIKALQAAGIPVTRDRIVEQMALDAGVSPSQGAPATPETDWSKVRGGPSSEIAKQKQREIDEKRKQTTPPDSVLRARRGVVQ